MTYRQICAILREAGVPDPETDGRILVEEAMGLSPAQFFLRREEDFACDTLTEWVERRRLREPLQYILGKWSFMGFDFHVSPSCLIPRSDTELLVETALKHLPQGGVFADLCTGSGCIALSLLKLRPDTRALCVDLSPEALSVAEKNAESLGVSQRVTFLRGDVSRDLFEGQPPFDLIVTNPPYVPTEDLSDAKPELSFEPLMALDGGEDGLDLIRPILRHYPKHVKRGSKLLVEFGYQSGALISEAAEEALLRGDLSAHEIVKDLSGNDRMLLATV